MILIGMYRREIYLRRLQAELKSIMQTQDQGCLAISPANNPFYYPASILTGFPDRLIAELINKKAKSEHDYVYLIVALKITSQSYLPYLSELKEFHPQTTRIESIDRLVEHFEKVEQKAEAKKSKEHIRSQF